MKPSNRREATWILAELRPDSFHARVGDRGLDLRVEREADRRLTPASAARVVEGLKRLIGEKFWLSRAKLVCALDSRGLILRAFPLPAIAPADRSRFLQLQIEGDFPLPPSALAWGWIPRLTPSHPSDRSEVWVAAVRKEVVEELTALLQPVTTDILFTPAALVRLALIPGGVSRAALLELGPTQCEFTLCEPGLAPSIRLIPWGGADQSVPPENSHSPVGVISDESLRRLLAAVPAAARKAPLWITGPFEQASAFALRLVGQWDREVSPQILAVPVGAGQTAALAGIAQILANNAQSTPSKVAPGAGSWGAGPLLELRTKVDAAHDPKTRKLPRRPVALAAALLALVLFLPYLEALLFQPALARRLAELKAGEAQLAIIDREFSFLQYLEQNQSPHLDATFVVAQAAPSGARVQSINLNRQGEVSLTGFLRDLAQVGDFRLKLINSGFFSTVVVEDQTPTPDRQRINFRINARWKDAAEREALALGPVLTNAVAKSTASNTVTSPTPTGPPRSVPAP